MDQQELDAFLGEERMCRLGSVNATRKSTRLRAVVRWDGSSALAPLRRQEPAVDQPRARPTVSVVIDAGVGYFELQAGPS